MVEARERTISPSAALVIPTTITDSVNGKIRISLTAAQTAELKAGRYYYDLFLHKDGENTRIIEGDVIVKKSVTRD